MATTFSNKVEILTDLWLNQKNAEQFADFVEYNDLGLPLAYLIQNNKCVATDEGIRLVDETFDLLIELADIEDTGFVNLNEVFALA